MQKYSMNSLWDFEESKIAGNLLIENNEINFEVNGHHNGRKSVFSTVKENDNIKVLVIGRERETDSKTKLNVKRVIRSNKEIELSDDHIIHNIKEAEFEIRGLDSWLDIEALTGKWNCEHSKFNILIEKVNDIVLFKNSEKEIKIIYIIQLDEQTQTKICIERKPKIRITYFEGVDDKKVFEDIKNISRFLGLLLGILGYIDNVKMIGVNKSIYQCYFNYDFSYDLMRSKLNELPGFYRLCFINIEHRLFNLFDRWEKLVNENCDMKFLINVYYLLYSKREFLIEDEFLNCCKFLEGYSLRRENVYDKNDKRIIKEEIKKIFVDKDNESIEKIKVLLNRFELDEKYASPVIISEVITSRIFSKNNLTLKDRLIKIDDHYSNCLTTDIVKRVNSFNIKEKPVSEEERQRIIKKIVDTRNYFSHFKDDDTGILNSEEILHTSHLLKKLITKILLFEIGFNIKEVDEIFF